MLEVLRAVPTGILSEYFLLLETDGVLCGRDRPPSWMFSLLDMTSTQRTDTTSQLAGKNIFNTRCTDLKLNNQQLVQKY